ncbi:MAG: Nascent polypeptide-associated complex protein [Candidatus Methanomethylophilaceae archaeon]|nr:Nascent polypeptide-associated complex protein [Candidatus Methanomethylophilaceae archaeon]
MPGMRMNDRQMKQAMKKMGITQSTVEDVTEVIIRTRTKEIVLKNPEVVCIEMPGNKSYQISGPETVMNIGENGEPEPIFSEEDISLIMSQTGCDRSKALEALKATDGQPAEAILKIISE